MGGFASAVFDQTMADPQVRNRLIRAMMGSDPSATMNPPQNDRIADDTTRHPAGFEEEAPHGAAAAPGSTEDLEARGTAGRLSLAAQMQQNVNQPPSHLDQMQQQYDAMQPPQPKKMSLLKALAIGIPTAGVGIPVAMRNAQLNQQFEEGRFDRNRQSLLAEIEAERRGQMQEQGASDRMISQQEMENQRQREMDQRQANLFGQQSGLERQRESLRQQMQQDTEAQRQSSQQAQFDQQDKRQNATFAEQEKLANLREQNKDNAKPTADETRRADLARNMNENLDQLEDIAKRRPDLFGKVAGRMTSLRNAIGTNDPDVAALQTIKEQMGMAMVGAHAMRNAQHVEAAARSIMNNFTNAPEAMAGAIKVARDSLGTFQQDAGEQQGSAPKANLKSKVSNQAPEGTRIQVGHQIQVKRNGRWVPEQQ